jgi:hypothetical protein
VAQPEALVLAVVAVEAEEAVITQLMLRDGVVASMYLVLALVALAVPLLLASLLPEMVAQVLAGLPLLVATLGLALVVMAAGL